MVFGMAAFKAHASLNFWHGVLVTGETGKEQEAMGAFGRITSLTDLPSAADLSAMIALAADLAVRGVKAPHVERDKSAKPEFIVPDALVKALAAQPAAAEIWAGFAPSHRREYAEWIAQAKRPETATKRIAQAIEWISEGKKRNWKYENC
jgi:uncharacterized protein YdeI (YjbR/CyaY-like superfamily)